MDSRKIIDILRGTIDPNLRQQAEEELTQMKKIIGFTPALLQVVMMGELDMPVRQAGVIYLKNMVSQYWKDAEYEGGEPIPFHIHEQDRAMIRDAIVDAVVHAPDLVRVQLAVCTYQMVKHDFPGRWTTIVDKISIYLQNPDTSLWNGGLLCLYQLVKNFEYKKKEDRGPLHEAMRLLLPMCYERMVHLLPDPSEHSTLLQKLILKIFYAFTQYHLPLELLSREQFTEWMEVIRQVADRPVPDQTLQVDEEERPDLPWWKIKKWALHILARIFERYGCPSTVVKEYKQFADWFIKTFTQGILQVLMKILDLYRNKIYISPRVLQQTLNYLEQGVGQSIAWKLLKPHMLPVIQDVLFPLMCYSDSDQELWNSDPYEYVRVKFDIYEDLVSPVTAAQALLLSTVRKRKEMLEKTMVFLMQVLTAPNVDPRHKDGVMHMIGTMGGVLLKKKIYKDQMETMIAQYVFPEFQSPYGFMRARACWILQNFDEIKFKSDQNIVAAMNCIQNALLNDHDLPVKVEAAMALSAFLASQNKAEKIVEPNIRPIVQELLKVIKETENDDLTNVMCKIVTTYTDQLTPIAVEMCTQLAATFQQVVDAEDGADEKAITAMGLLSTIETLINCMEENPKIMEQIEPITLQVVGLILTKNVMEFYEEALALIYSLTSTRISPDLWQCFEMMYQMFRNDGFDYFTEMMPALHNYITVDPEAFLSNEAHLVAVYEMCKTILTQDCSEDDECHAAKLLEVVVLQCQGRINQCLGSIIQLVVERLLREVKTTELRTMLLQVVIATLYTAPDPLLQVLESTTLPNTTTTLTSHFIKQWIHDTDCFLGLHDRKICVLGMCTLLQLGPERLGVLQECHKEILPAMLLLFQGLKRAYAAKASEEDDDDDDDDDDDGDLEHEVLESDEDELDDVGDEYLEKLEEKVNRASAAAPFTVNACIQDDDDDDDDEEGLDEEMDETALESFTTPLDKDECEVDEYWVFKEVMQNLQTSAPVWYQALTGGLSGDQLKTMQEVATLADQRHAAAQSKKIQQSGGYNFQQTAVPASFNFGGSFGS
ncbi:importin-7-like isoform X2 [Homarus americanus]|uniref:importin-7-like isoform X2 n=1 Tax=Homarus americanus TaxID=6706 RepID=UPI001C47A08D|nr:importin-7-like isoform X2 [Homarus americanus]